MRLRSLLAFMIVINFPNDINYAWMKKLKTLDRFVIAKALYLVFIHSMRE